MVERTRKSLINYGHHAKRFHYGDDVSWGGGGRLAGINREAPRGRQGPMVDKAVIRLIFQKMKERPANVASWTVRSLARELGISPATLHRVWKACDLDSSQK